MTGRLDLRVSGELISGLADLFFEALAVVRRLARCDVVLSEFVSDESDLAEIGSGRLTHPLVFAGSLPFPLPFITGFFPFPDVYKTKIFGVN